MKKNNYLSNKELNQSNVNSTKKEALSFLVNSKLKKGEVLKFNTVHNPGSVENYLNVIASTYNTDLEGLKKIFADKNISFQLFEEGVKTEYAWQQLIYNFHQDKIKLNLVK